jgi:hypothetical protein
MQGLVSGASPLVPAERSAGLPPDAGFGLVDEFARNSESVRCNVQQFGFLGYEDVFGPHGEPYFVECFPDLLTESLDVDFDCPASESDFLLFHRQTICAQMQIKGVCGEDALDMCGGQRLRLLPRKDIQKN